MEGVGKSAFLNGQLAISWKRQVIGTRDIINRKWHTPFHMR